jgi:hypothetical protein
VARVADRGAIFREGFEGMTGNCGMLVGFLMWGWGRGAH